MNDKTYNGWTNYETWLCNLWLDNDQGNQEYWTDRATEIRQELIYDDTEPEDLPEHTALRLREEIKDSIEEQVEQLDLGASMFSDLLGAAISEINFYEIAEHFVFDLPAPEIEDEDEEESEEN